LQAFRVGVDVGGTFTDIVCLGHDGSIYTHKVPSSVDDYSRAMQQGLQTVLQTHGIAGAAISELVHGATVASNTILEYKGARTGLLTTEGFRDVLEIRRIRMPRLYDMRWQKPPPLVERALRLEVSERINFRGEILRPLDLEAARKALDQLRHAGVQAIAICLLHAYVNPVHEQRLAAFIRHTAPDIYLSLSSEVQPEIKEYERTSTTVIDAYIKPVVQRYLQTMEAGLQGLGITAPLLVMQSSGGVVTSRGARDKPVHMIESGPVAGITGCLQLGQRLNYPNIITFDMGGTTAKASIIEAGQVSRAHEYEVGAGLNIGHRLLKGGGYLVRVPGIDVAEVGAGGGSIAWVDKGGALQVGPQSAGATPGPVCYNLGGTTPTVTDANVLLGYLNPDYLIGGALALDADKARYAITKHLAEPLGLDPVAAAYGVRVIATANMIRAVRAVSVERGRDPRDFVLFAFGGNGPGFAVDMARALHISRLLIPPAAGLFSAFGLLFSELEHHYVRTFLRRAEALEVGELQEQWRHLETEALATLQAEGYAPERVELHRFADMRYAGQNSELTIPAPMHDLVPEAIVGLLEDFGQEHEKTYGYRSANEPVELVNIRLTARGVSAQSRLPQTLCLPDEPYGAMLASRRVYFGPEHGYLDTPIQPRTALGEAAWHGPLIIEEYDATTVIPPGCRAMLDAWGNIVVGVEMAKEDA
jgi:N-methylhydantoinase A